MNNRRELSTEDALQLAKREARFSTVAAGSKKLLTNPGSLKKGVSSPKATSTKKTVAR